MSFNCDVLGLKYIINLLEKEAQSWAKLLKIRMRNLSGWLFLLQPKREDKVYNEALFDKSHAR